MGETEKYVIWTSIGGGFKFFWNFHPENWRRNSAIGGGAIFSKTYFEYHQKLGKHTLPETNIAPENRPSQKEIHLPTVHFQVLL